MGEGKEICCCTAHSWTKVIAWVQIVYFGLGLALMVLYVTIYVVDPDMFAQLWDQLIQSYERLNLLNDTTLVLFNNFPMSTIIMLGIMMLIHVAMGIVLLYGAHKRNLSALLAWIIYASICILLSFTQLRSFDGSVNLLMVMAAILVYAFEIWMVQKYRRDIRKAKDEARALGDRGRGGDYFLDGPMPILMEKGQFHNESYGFHKV